MRNTNFSKIFLFKVIVFLIVLSAIFILLTCACQSSASKNGGEKKTLEVEVSADKFRARPGEVITVSAAVKAIKISSSLKVSAELFVPREGAKNLSLQIKDKNNGFYQAQVKLGPEAAEGLYGITVKAASGSSSAVGKASFLVGKVIADFYIVSALPKENTEQDVADYLNSFLNIGGNMLVIHDIVSEKAWYPSRICSRAATTDSADDRVGLTLKLADKLGLPSLISVVWDTTRQLPYAERMESTKSILKELWLLYGHHPSLVGFYNYQEGSGTYLASQVRGFSDAVKAQDKGLLTACAPYIDDPLLAGYLAAIDSLDIVIYQGAVMASYRPDNRKCFPLRRTKDFSALSSGATLIKNKISLSHVELFGYLEKSYAHSYLASYKDIYGQILSAATCYGPDGITLFTYHYNIHNLSKKIPEAKNSGLGVSDGLKAYRLLSQSAAREPSQIALYIPYNDWWCDRWTSCYLPALDSFRRLGMAADIIPFVPPKGEEILPYYPMSLNREQLEFLLDRNYVIILPDISGMQETDSLLLKEFVERGGVAVLFGPHIPYGDRFDRAELCGGGENKAASHYRIEVKEAIQARVRQGEKFAFESTDFSSWSPTAGRAVASFEDGSAAVLRNNFGKGAVMTIPVNMTDMVRIAPALVRDIIDFALAQRGVKRAFDIIGANEDMDIAVSLLEGEYRLAVVNYRDKAAEVKICPLNLAFNKIYRLVDLRTGRLLAKKTGRNLTEIGMRIGPNDFLALALATK
jgi:hypothetical protein